MADKSLLVNVKQAIKTWGWSLCRTYRDSHGPYAIKATYEGQTYIAVAKGTAYNDLASFGPKVVRRACDINALVVEFFGEPSLGTAYAYRPDTILEDGEVSRGESKKGVTTDWYQIPLERGAILGDVVSGREVPPAPIEDRPVGITDYA